MEDESEEDVSCIICNELLSVSETVTVTSKGIRTLINYSLQRKDGLNSKFETLSTVSIHKECRKVYTRSSSIKAYIASSKNIEDFESSSAPIKRRSDFQKFNFKEHCLFCGMDAVVNPKTPTHYRKPVHLVHTLTIKQTISKYIENRNDDWGDLVRSRLEGVVDLVAAEGRYHSDCYARFSKQPTQSPSTSAGRGRPVDDLLKESFIKVCDFIEESDDCQHRISDLLQLMKSLSGRDQVYESKYFKTLLLNHFGERLLITNITNKSSIVCLRDRADKVLSETWYSQKKNNKEDEIRRIVSTAAALIRQEIQNQVYDDSSYPSVEDIRSGGKDVVPELLNLFLNDLTKRRRQSSDESPDVKRKRITINHMILKLCRPRSFHSPVQSAFGLYLSRQYGSKHLIDLCSSLGFSTSYYETETYLQSLLKAGEPQIEEGNFFQFVFDNIDINLRTLDGKDTFHALGGIQCVTPKTAVTSDVRVPRVKTYDFEGTFNVPVIQYAKRAKSGLKSLTIDNISESMPTQSLVSARNMLWLSSFAFESVSLPGWSGYMRNCYDGRQTYEPSYVLALPFINIDPGNPTAIYSALSYASKESKLAGQPCIVTFDQPLFLKAVDIVASASTDSDISGVIVRLGGFHLLMSFLGCLGKFMEGSGIEEMWTTVYGKSTIPHLMSGHAYARSYRAHMMTQAALMLLLLEECSSLKDLIINEFRDIHNQTVNKQKTVEDAMKESKTNEIMTKLEEVCEGLVKTSRTSKLWLQEFKLANLVLDFILAERIGDWNLHINTVKQMIPYFHAAGHLLYAKSAQIYLQQMLSLQTKMSNEDFERFVNKGFFTVRRTDGFFTGNWTDMTIEQTLMRSSKSIGGLTHGRGLSERTLTKFIACAPGSLQICEAFEKFSGCVTQFNEQHTELRCSRRERDLQDINKFLGWLRIHNPFRQSNDLVSLSSGLVVTSSSVNCDEAYDVGLNCLKDIEGNNFADVKLKRKNKVTTIGSVVSGIDVRSEEVPINPDQLFNRVICMSQGTNNLKHYFNYELSPYPLSLFENNKMLRKGTKSSIMKIFEKWTVSNEAFENLPQKIYVVDGGYLLHSVVWPDKGTYSSIIEKYVETVIKRYGKDCHVVFDGYPDYPTTKGLEHIRRSKRTSLEIKFNLNMECSVKQNEFLANPKNKSRFIEQLAQKLNEANIPTIVAEEDADTEVVGRAIDVSKIQSGRPIVVVGQDTDLFVLLLGLPQCQNVQLFFHKPSGTPSSYDISKIREEIGDMKDVILFLHAITGCDTTSSLFGKGKINAYKLLSLSNDLRAKALQFYEKQADKNILKEVGETFVLKLYGCTRSTSLNESRYSVYLKAVAKMSLKSKFNMASLPPTSDAAEQHTYRTYYQIQKWIGDKEIRATDWGWILTDNILYPVHSKKPPAPEEVINLVSCNCKKACKNNCSCFKASLDCTEMCGSCGGSCSNVTVAEVEENEELLMEL